MSGRKKSLKELLYSYYPYLSPQEIYSSIMCGEYCINGESIRAPKALVSNDSHVEWKPRKYVSRGGQKLEAALDYFCLSPMGSVCLDAGASTGGFTDCLLKRGAKIVHAVDVGFNQIAWTLRTHKQVNVMEKTNIMKIIPGDLQPSPEFATADLSFRSLRKVATRLLQLTHGKTVLALAKPQFEYPQRVNLMVLFVQRKHGLRYYTISVRI